jgi:phosphoglycerol transferase MdoB-like AlkP superfamily enzyme
MIDWFNLAANTLWILGLAIALAVVSHAAWQAALNHEKIRTRLAQPGYQRFFDLAAVLFCLGMAATSRRAWEIILWCVLAVLFIGQAVFEKLSRKP